MGDSPSSSSDTQSTAPLNHKKRKNLKRKERQKKAKEEKSNKRAKLSESTASDSDTSQPPTPGGPADDFTVQVEYVPENPLEDLGDDAGSYADFSDVFSKFVIPEARQDSSKTAEDRESGAEKEEKDGDDSDADGENEDVAELKKKMSKRQKRLARRLSIAVLKQMVKRPELVEIWDTCAQDPFLLCHLKSYRNIVPIPRHWSQRRKYLQVPPALCHSDLSRPSLM